MNALRKALPAAALLLALQVPPASAGLLDDLFGGGGGGGCGGGGGGLLGGLPGLGGLFGGGEGEGGGCPVVESEPFAVEGMIHNQELELVLQTAHMVTQIENMVKMRQLAGIDSAADIAGALGEVRRAAGLVGRVLWGINQADADFRRLYPDALPEGLDVAGVLAHQAEQAHLAREASRASKLVTAEAVTGLESYPARVEALMGAVKACEGQTCALDAATQAVLLTAELGGRLLAVQAAHHRAVEAGFDYEQGAVERARQHTLLSWQGLDSYGGPGN
jgi:type IV secretion system protein TrbJ